MSVKGGGPNARAFRDEMRPIVLGALEQGSTYRAATGAAGIPWSTWLKWSKAVREGECLDTDVEALVNDARRVFEAATVALTTNIRVASAEDWKAAAFLVQHRQGAPKAAADARRAQHEATIAKHRAEGTHVDRVSVDTPKTREELIAEARSIAAAIEADAPTKH